MFWTQSLRCLLPRAINTVSCITRAELMYYLSEENLISAIFPSKLIIFVNKIKTLQKYNYTLIFSIIAYFHLNLNAITIAN